jgi:hypothetical protein
MNAIDTMARRRIRQWMGCREVQDRTLYTCAFAALVLCVVLGVWQ